jgi:hypothetical protein
MRLSYRCSKYGFLRYSYVRAYFDFTIFLNYFAYKIE